MGKYISTKVIELGSTAFRQPKADSHCKFIHGYQLKAKIWFACNELDSNNWVFDFGGLKELKEKLQNHFDHKCVIADSDPAKGAFRELQRYGAIDLVIMDGVGIEKFAEYVANEADVYVKYKTQNRVWVNKVEVFEHDDNSAIYILSNHATCTEKTSKKVTEDIKVTDVKLEDFVDSNIKTEPSGPIPAPVGNKTSTGYANPFAGTSWGV